MKLRSIISLFFITLLVFGTAVEAKSSSSSRSSSSSSRSSSSSSSSYSKSYSTPTTTKATTTSTYTKSYSAPTPTTTAPTSTKTKTYTSTPTTPTPSYGGTTASSTKTYTAPNPNYTNPTKQTATRTETVNNRTIIYSQGAGGNGSTFMDSVVGTMAGMAIYDMITDDSGKQVKVEPYYVSGEQRIPVGTGTVIPKTVTQPVVDETSPIQKIFIGAFIVLAVLFSAVVGKAMFFSPNSY